jgi:hypothetical protein
MKNREYFEKEYERLEAEKERLEEEEEEFETNILDQHLIGLGFTKETSLNKDPLYTLIVDNVIKYEVVIPSRSYRVSDLSKIGTILYSYDGKYYDNDNYPTGSKCAMDIFKKVIDKTPEFSLLSVTPEPYQLLTQSSNKPKRSELIKTYKLGQ